MAKEKRNFAKGKNGELWLLPRVPATLLLKKLRTAHCSAADKQEVGE